MWHIIKCPNTHVTGRPEGEEKKEERNMQYILRIFKEIMVRIFQNLVTVLIYTSTMVNRL